MRGDRAICLLLVLMTAAARGGVFELTVLDERDRRLPCRVLLRPHGGECIVPEGAVVVRVGPDRWFVSSGQTEVEVPDGRVELRVEHGLEYVRVKRDIELSGPATAQTVKLERWVNMKTMGYVCGENHIHVGSASLGPMLAAEGLDFGTSLTWWNGAQRGVPVPSGSGRVRVLTFAGRSVPTSIYDAELEYGWGAAYLLNLPAPMPLKTERRRPNLDYVRHAAESGGMVHYQGGWSREVALDALLGLVDTVNICNNQFHLHRFLPRSRYSNLLDVPGFPVYPDTPEGMLRMNTDTYYRLLNWGLKLPAGAGTACGVKRNPVGFNRGYVRAAPGASLDEFNRAWAAGKNFVTNGPILLLKTVSGRRPGDTIEFPAGGSSVGLDVRALSDLALTSVEIVVNGRVAKSFEITDRHELAGHAELEIPHGAWIAARATARDDLLRDEELARHSTGVPNAPFPERPCRLRFAHTSPIYVTVDGRQAAVRRSIDEGFKMLDRFEIFAQENASEEFQPAIIEAVDEAREKLRRRLDDVVP